MPTGSITEDKLIVSRDHSDPVVGLVCRHSQGVSPIQGNEEAGRRANIAAYAYGVFRKGGGQTKQNDPRWD